MKQMKIRHEQELAALRRTLEREKQLLRSSVGGISSPRSSQRPLSLYSMPPSRAETGGYLRDSHLTSPTKSAIPDSMYSQHDRVDESEPSHHEEMDLDEGFHHHHHHHHQQQPSIKRTSGYNDPRHEQALGAMSETRSNRSSALDAFGVRSSYHEGSNNLSSPIKSRFDIQSETDKQAHDWKRASEVTDELRRRITEMKKRSEMNKAMYGSK